MFYSLSGLFVFINNVVVINIQFSLMTCEWFCKHDDPLSNYYSYLVASLCKVCLSLNHNNWCDNV